MVSVTIKAPWKAKSGTTYYGTARPSTRAGYEVIRGGQGYSTAFPETGDIIIRKVGGGGEIKTSAQLVAEREAQEQEKARIALGQEIAAKEAERLMTTREGVIRPAPLTKYQKAERWTRERVTEPYLWGPLGRRGITPEIIGKATQKIAPVGMGLLPVITRPAPSPLVTHPKLLEYQKEFVTGYMKEVREKPLKEAAIFGAAAAAPLVIRGVGVGARALGITAKVSAIGKAYPALKPATAILKPTIRYGLPTAYGVSVGARVIRAPSPAMELGRITAGEIVPMAAGFKAGAYGLRRYETYAEIRKVKAALPGGQKKLLEQQLKEAKAFRKVQPRVKELSLGGMERIPPKAKPTVLKYIKTHRGEFVIGGTAGTRTQLLVKEIKPPHDIDIFFQGGKARTYAKELASQLKDVKGVKAIKGAVYYKGAKAVEFHPLETHLRFNIEQVVPWFRTWRAGITKTPSGIRVLRMGAQYPMKTLGYYRYGARRLKDILYARKVARPTLIKAAQFEPSISRVQPLTQKITLIREPTLKKVSFRVTPTYPTYPKTKLLPPAPYPYRKDTLKQLYPGLPKKEPIKTSYPTYPEPPRKIYPPIYPPTHRPPRRPTPTAYPSYKPYKPPMPPPPIIITTTYKKPPIKPTVLIMFPNMKKRKIPRGFRVTPQPQKYVPSLTAAILRVKGKKPYVIPKQFKFGFFPGLRPIAQ